MIEIRMKDAIRRFVINMLGEPAIRSIIEQELGQLRTCENCAGCKRLEYAIPSLSRLVVDKECRIFLSDYNYVEIKIKGYQSKSLYLLYLLSESGISNESLGQHKTALISIYKETCKDFACDNYRAEEVVAGLINRSGGISDANNKIRRALHDALPSNESVREYYMIGGVRNCAREVRLPKELITIENEVLLEIFNNNTNKKQL